MQNKYDDQILKNLAELNDTEIEELIGAGLHWPDPPPFITLNTWRSFLTCCS